MVSSALSIPVRRGRSREKCGSEDVSHMALTLKSHRDLRLVGAGRWGPGRGWIERDLPGEMLVEPEKGLYLSQESTWANSSKEVVPGDLQLQPEGVTAWPQIPGLIHASLLTFGAARGERQFPWVVLWGLVSARARNWLCRVWVQVSPG